jgi:two-component system, NarL family, response regulator
MTAFGLWQTVEDELTPSSEDGRSHKGERRRGMNFWLDAGMTGVKEKTIRVMVVDAQAITREGLAAIIEKAAGMAVVAQAAEGTRALELYREHQPDVVLADIYLPGMGGIELIAALTAEFPRSRIITLTNRMGQEDIYRALRAGARSYLLKDTTREELLRTIRSVHAGQRLLSGAVSAHLAARVADSDLTPRELDVLRLILKGQSNKMIAATLKIAESTVKGHVNNILSKMGVNDRTHAVTTALRRGIIHLD